MQTNLSSWFRRCFVGDCLHCSHGLPDGNVLLFRYGDTRGRSTIHCGPPLVAPSSDRFLVCSINRWNHQLNRAETITCFTGNLCRDHRRLTLSLLNGPSTLMRFRLKTYVFLRFHLPSTLIRSKTKVYICETGGFRKRFPEWRFWKTDVLHLVWTRKN